MDRDRVYELVMSEIRRKKMMAKACRDETAAKDHMEVAEAMLETLRAYIFEDD